MKIVHIILTRRFAGSERYAVELANMQSRQHEVSLVLFRNAGEDRADAIAKRVGPGVNVIYVSNFKPLAVWQARRAIRRLAPDVSHAHLSWGCRVLAGMGRDAGARIATLHIRYKSKQHQSLDGLIAIAPWQLDELPEALHSCTRHIDNWSTAKQPMQGARTAMRRQYGIPEQALVFGTLGRLDHSKGLDVVIKAFQKAALPGARLVIVGDGKARHELETMAGAHVVFPGYTSEPENWLAAFDVFVSAARSEPFGLVFLEAMHAQLPIIASASEGALHLEKHIARPLIAIDDVDGFAKSFETFAQQPAECPRYQLGQFDATQRCADVVAFYRELREQAGTASG